MSTTQDAPIPLTTTFKPPNSCFNELWWYSTSGTIWMNLGPTDTSGCLPSGWATSSYFSPGICPSGYGVATTGLVDWGTSTESVATCCPIVGSNTYTVRPSTVTPYQSTLGTEVCVWGPKSDVMTTYNYTWSGKDGSPSSTSDSMIFPDYFNAYGIEIRWKSTDFSDLPATASATATQDTSATSTSSQSSASSDSSSKLSSGAKAGIGVGVAAGVIAVIILALFLWFQRRKARQGGSVPIPENSQDIYLPNVGRSDGHAYDAQQGGAQVAELSTARNTPFIYQKAELSAETQRDRRYELE
ncbi:hypothetical protein BDV27DRAFT_152263 [Aspergillus caelatus]|uniref:Mid2 domain-containing protein n=1 Tax=Aspergillus caelatus TaxID=61420 RepID=A0A5N7AKD1_9EURO|nr:uncharacterized protein BDV27DRAFT_152263 [Aspergillus caelatus]KAE8370384.1 hypothetical protein BDV27DRAFT_152263 [Aspergillus caelatus]